MISHNAKALVRCAALVFAVGALTACGGGGGDTGTSTPTPQPPTNPPPTGDTVVSGKITFDRVPHNANNGLNYAGITQDPARGVTVEILNAADAILASDTTDENGDYSMTVGQGQDVRLRVRAELLASGTPAWDFSVVDNTAADALYVIEGPSQLTDGDTQTRNLLAESGWGGSAYTTDRAAGPFAILDSVYDAVSKVIAEDASIVFPPLTIHWSENNRPQDGNPSDGDIVTSFYTRDAQGNSEIFLLGAANQDTDEYDTHVVIHEWGHYFEDRFSRSDSVGGPHSGGDRLDLRVAFSEGFGYALAGMVTDNPITRDSGGANQASGFQIDVEDDNPGTNFSGNLNPGWYSEGSVQLILYDIYDSNSDGIDSVSLGFGPILDTLRGSFATDTAVASIFSFVEALQANQAASASAIDDLLEAKDIVGSGNDRYGSTETNNAGNANDVLPVFTSIATDGTPQTVCSIGGTGFGQFGEFNKLSNRRLLRFNVTTPGRYRMAVTGAQDPDIVLFQGDFLAVAQTAGNDAIERDLSAGEHVLEVYDYANLRPDDAPHAAGRYCLTVTVSAI
ncbi:MAG: hypothetical protein AB8G16_09530 [Gammaproteobacteria bacterium]